MSAVFSTPPSHPDVYTLTPNEVESFQATANNLKVNSVARDALGKDAANLVGVKLGNQGIIYYNKNDFQHIELERSHKALKQIWDQFINPRTSLSPEKIATLYAEVQQLAQKINKEMPFELNSQKAEAKRLIEALNTKLQQTTAVFNFAIDNSLPPFPKNKNLDFEVPPDVPSPIMQAQSEPLSLSIRNALLKETGDVAGEDIAKILQNKVAELKELIQFATSTPGFHDTLRTRQAYVANDLRSIPDLKALNLTKTEQSLLSEIEKLAITFLTKVQKK